MFSSFKPPPAWNGLFVPRAFRGSRPLVGEGERVMKSRAILALTAVAGLASAASAQVITQNSTASFTLSFQDTGNNNGVVEPGESALITMSVSFTGQNTIGTFSPPIGTFTSGTIRGLGAGFVDLNGTANNGGN